MHLLVYVIDTQNAKYQIWSLILREKQGLWAHYMHLLVYVIDTQNAEEDIWDRKRQDKEMNGSA